MAAGWIDVTLSTGTATIQGRMWSDNGTLTGNMSQGFIPLDASLNPTGIASNPLITQPVDEAATTGSITAADVATTTTTNSLNQTVITGAPTASSFVTCALSGNSSVNITVSGTDSGTLAFERSSDGGTTYVPFSVELLGVGAAYKSITITDNNPYVFRGNGAITNVRVRCTTYTSGTFVIKIQPGVGTGVVISNQGVPNSNAYPWPSTDTPQTTGGYSTSTFISTGAVQATNAKNTAGQIYRVNFTNINATPVYVRLYNKATAPSTSDTPIWRITVPGNTAGAGIVETFPAGLACSLGVGYRVTSGIADNDATVLVASTVLGNIAYF